MRTSYHFCFSVAIAGVGLFVRHAAQACDHKKERIDQSGQRPASNAKTTAVHQAMPQNQGKWRCRKLLLRRSYQESACFNRSKALGHLDEQTATRRTRNTVSNERQEQENVHSIVSAGRWRTKNLSSVDALQKELERVGQGKWLKPHETTSRGTGWQGQRT